MFLVAQKPGRDNKLTGGGRTPATRCAAGGHRPARPDLVVLLNSFVSPRTGMPGCLRAVGLRDQRKYLQRVLSFEPTSKLG